MLNLTTNFNWGLADSDADWKECLKWLRKNAQPTVHGFTLIASEDDERVTYALLRWSKYFDVTPIVWNKHD